MERLLNLRFFVTSILLGVGLAMDAFSVSLANGLHEPQMKGRRMCGIAMVFALFQAAMPLLGWICIHTIISYFRLFERLIPWIALGLLAFIGSSMIVESIREGEQQAPAIGLRGLLVQGVATSIDALSVGFTIAEYTLPVAVLAAAVIACVTFIICMAGLYIGRRAGTKLAGKAGILGGIILIAIGLEIFITSFV